MIRQKQGFVLGLLILAFILAQCVSAEEKIGNRTTLHLKDRAWALKMDLGGFTIGRHIEEENQAFLDARSITQTTEVFLELIAVDQEGVSLQEFAKSRWERMRMEVRGYPDNVVFNSDKELVTITYSLAMSDEMTKGFVLFERFENVLICARVEKSKYRSFYQKAVEDLIDTIGVMRLYRGTEDSEEAKSLRVALQNLKIQDSKSAEDNLKKTIEQNNTNGFAWFLLGNIYRASNRLEDANKAYQRALEQELKSVFLTPYLQKELIRQFANVEKELGHDKQADTVYQKGIQLDPESPGCYYEYARYLAEQGKNDKSMEMLEQACRKALFYPGEKMPRPDEDPSFERLKNNSKFQAILKKYSSLF